ncbi:hypothetical protein P154DRAFT_455974 [Amniculicola lignicola CBS 123094]|uniref:Lariat debranching enzyme C-terminal domain-containing protein n=1 Tax=Amniculicola lignicola CBS 123094 TaxID=1392246 RepID=A0A6A5WWS3_9PLEO|nr:hypothetical protein P154DRAFT_455974 [Amniculicola lignicola CBS 123094]
MVPLLKIAVEGCGHGSLDIIYSALEKSCESKGWKLLDLDFLIICGDFQAVRNERDLNCMSVPSWHRKIGDFHSYYSGEKKAPVLTLVVGGNHEASSYLSELHHGGWLAPNIYYLGTVGILRYGPLRIVGLSGIYHSTDYTKPRQERLPYDKNEIRSIYHVRECDISKVLQLRSPIDIGISHDWPRRVEWFGDHKILFARRPHFLESVRDDRFGSAPAEQIMNHLRPKYWFSGHMHIKFTAKVQHKDNVDDILKDLEVPNELQAHIPKSMFSAPFRGDSQTRPPNVTNTVTNFLGLDKPGPHRDFLEVQEVTSCSYSEEDSAKPWMERTPEGRFTLHYDEEWLSILRSSDGGATTAYEPPEISLGDSEVSDTSAASRSLDWVQANITAKGLLRIPENFEKHAPVYDPNDQTNAKDQPDEFPNTQTEAFCTMLQIRNGFSVGEGDDEGSDNLVFG